MCEIAPFCMKCEWEDVQDKLIMCHANRLKFSFTEISRLFPIVGDLIAPYRCKGFQIPHEELNLQKGE